MGGLLGVGQSALMAAYAQLQTTGHNIANANTAGYSRQEAVLATAPGQYSGGGFIGMGVDVVTVQRRYDRFLSAELASSMAAASADQARAAQLGRVDRLLADTENGIGVAIDELSSGLADVVNRPFDPSARQIVLQRADTLAYRMRETGAQLQRIGAEANEQVRQAAADASATLARFAALNERIAQATASGHAPNDLLDERDRLLVEINGQLRVTAHARDDGTVDLFGAGGEGLVVGSRAARLLTEPDPLDTSRQRVVMAFGGTRLPMDANSLGGGALAGLVRFRDVDLPAMRARIENLGTAIADAFNRQQALGVDADGNPGEPMFSVAGGELTRTLSSGARLATAYAMTAQAPASNAGDVAVHGYAVLDASDANLRAPVTLTFNADGTFDAAGTGTAGASGVAWVAGEPIEFNGWSVTLRGTPRAGDRIEIVATADPARDNRNARAMIALSGAPLVDGATFNDAFAATLADVGERTRSAQVAESASNALLSNARSAQTQHSAVNLDEEAARLMQFQQMYQAAAKVIQAGQAMFDTLLAATGR